LIPDDDAALIDYLGELAERLDIETRYEIIRQEEDLPFVPMMNEFIKRSIK